MPGFDAGSYINTDTQASVTTGPQIQIVSPDTSDPTMPPALAPISELDSADPTIAPVRSASNDLDALESPAGWSFRVGPNPRDGAAALQEFIDAEVRVLHRLSTGPIRVPQGPKKPARVVTEEERSRQRMITHPEKFLQTTGAYIIEGSTEMPILACAGLSTSNSPMRPPLRAINRRIAEAYEQELELEKGQGEGFFTRVVSLPGHDGNLKNFRNLNRDKVITGVRDQLAELPLCERTGRRETPIGVAVSTGGLTELIIEALYPGTFAGLVIAGAPLKMRNKKHNLQMWAASRTLQLLDRLHNPLPTLTAMIENLELNNTGGMESYHRKGYDTESLRSVPAFCKLWGSTLARAFYPLVEEAQTVITKRLLNLPLFVAQGGEDWVSHKDAPEAIKRGNRFDSGERVTETIRTEHGVETVTYDPLNRFKIYPRCPHLLWYGDAVQSSEFYDDVADFVRRVAQRRGIQPAEATRLAG